MKFFLLIILILSSCAGTGPKPVRVFQPNDQYLSCSNILNEVDNILFQLDVNVDNHKLTRRDNVAYFITGQLLLIPMLGMDVSGSNQIKKKSLVMRLERLKEISTNNGC
ncbi:MAG: hypothetical protein P8I49_02265 [SAR86 cluster bacterium]|nr:hypothetical protein [SAR86 cluster bacterium]